MMPGDQFGPVTRSSEGTAEVFAVRPDEAEGPIVERTDGAAASANLYSLIESAKANGLEPHAYLTHLFTRLPHSTTIADFEALLPWNVKVALAH